MPFMLLGEPVAFKHARAFALLRPVSALAIDKMKGGESNIKMSTDVLGVQLALGSVCNAERR